MIHIGWVSVYVLSVILFCAKRGENWYQFSLSFETSGFCLKILGSKIVQDLVILKPGYCGKLCNKHANYFRYRLFL